MPRCPKEKNIVFRFIIFTFLFFKSQGINLEQAVEKKEEKFYI